MPLDFLKRRGSTADAPAQSAPSAPVLSTALPEEVIAHEFQLKLYYAGKSSDDSIEAMQFIRDTEYEFYGGFLQGMLGANPRHEPQIGFDRVQSAEDRYLFDADGRLVYQVGHVFTLQMHIVDRSHTRGLFVGDFFAIEANGPRCLNKFPLQLVRTKA